MDELCVQSHVNVVALYARVKAHLNNRISVWVCLVWI